MLNKEERNVLAQASKENFFLKVKDISNKINLSQYEIKNVLERLYQKGIIDKFDDMHYCLDPYKTSCIFIDLCKHFVWKKKGRI